MKCWKCGTENTEGAGKCLNCGTTLTRTACVTEEGKALRQMYDQYGAETVLTQRGYLTNGLGDFLPDSGKLRNQLKMVLDIGVGECYLEQLKEEGRPSVSFRTKIRRMIVEDAGLSDKVADNIMGYLDEMIGWPTGGSSGHIERAAKGSHSGKDGF